MIHFVGAGSGAPDLITVRGKKYLEEADVVIYAGSLVNPKLLEYTKDICTIYNSAKMTLEEVLSVMEKAEAAGKTTVRLHTGDPCIYGAIREQMDVLDEKGIAYDYCPGVSAFCGAASALNLEYTLPDISQSVIITRMEGRTPVPPKESIQSFAAHQATMVVFLSTGMLEELSRRLIEGGYTADTPAAIVYKATWEDEKKFVCTVGTLAQTAKENHITKTALMIIGDCVNAAHYDRSKLYDPGFTTELEPVPDERKTDENFHDMLHPDRAADRRETKKGTGKRRKYSFSFHKEQIHSRFYKGKLREMDGRTVRNCRQYHFHWSSRNRSAQHCSLYTKQKERPGCAGSR